VDTDASKPYKMDMSAALTHKETGDIFLGINDKMRTQ
jgi:hypothetical protein